MTLSLLLIGGTALAIVAVLVTASRAYDVAPSLAGEAPAVGVGNAATETLTAAGTDEHAPSTCRGPTGS